ncbi:type II toxin-antitoxin system HicB family antitoxin [Francisella sp. TX07-6608]|uniref:type II toxin-antitoxin system HicB family antitoxin n=1 Tax=Francisella sp. TX07-6608 TaxID=573568 RepID=UPI0008F9B461|nr:type II toxin-antitoxin system HicB family antitoxin [Francisella sp. TX07-6608]OIN85080.1 hicB family protein [Francisella sp. TX07-6608]
MNNLIKYKGYYGSVEFDEESMVFYGQIQFIRSLISYEAENAKELVDSFHSAVDEYLEDCKQRSVEPEKAFRGTLNVRLGTDLHEKVAIAASNMGTSINDFIKQTLNKNTA